MSEMVERVARAIDGILGDDHESLSMEMGCGSIGARLRKEAMEKAARAAIAAMREPTEEMIEAGIERMDLSSHGPIDKTLPQAFRDMIDAALKP